MPLTTLRPSSTTATAAAFDPPPAVERAAERAPRAVTAGPRVAGALLLIVLLALAARVAAVLVLGAWNHPAEAMEHRSIANNLVGEGVFAFRYSEYEWYGPSSVQSPTYPLVLAGAFKLFGQETAAAWKAVLLLNCAVGALTCGLTYLVVRQACGTAAVGLSAAALVAVWPTQVYLAAHPQAIALITACGLACLALWYRAVDSGRLTPWLAFAIVGCVGALTEPVLLPFMFFSGLVVMFWRPLHPALRLRNAVLLAAVAAATFGPWARRNYLVHDGQLMPVKSTFWFNVWKGNNPNATGTDRLALTPELRARLNETTDPEVRRALAADALHQADALTLEQKNELFGTSEIEREAIFGKWTKDWIASNPAAYAKLSLGRVWKTLWIEHDNPKGQGRKEFVLYVVPRTFLLAATVVGLVVAWRARWRLGMPLLLAGTGLLTFALTITAARFALPYEPLQLALVALLAVGVWHKVRGEPKAVLA